MPSPGSWTVALAMQPSSRLPSILGRQLSVIRIIASNGPSHCPIPGRAVGPPTHQITLTTAHHDGPATGNDTLFPEGRVVSQYQLNLVACLIAN